MSNPYIRELHLSASKRFSIDADDMPMSQWLIENTKLKGRKFSLDRYPFQRALLDDESKNSVTLKPSQVGVSELYQRLALAFVTRNRNVKGIYAYPDDEMRKKNAQTRVLPLLKETKAFNPSSTDSPVRSIELLQVGTSFLYMTGSKTGDATSIDADFVFLDEYDLHDMSIAALYSSRLQNSEWKIKRKFSTPTYTGFGVDLDYAASDQTEYLIRCDSCNTWQFPMFDTKWVHIENLPSDINSLEEIDQGMIDRYRMDVAGAYVCCERCRAALDLGRESNRAWVSRYPSRTGLKGWRINPFSVSTRPICDIIHELGEYKRLNFIRGFKNSVLGEAEDSSNQRLNEADIKACFTGRREVPAIRKDLPTWVGIDMGHSCTLTVGQGYDAAGLDIVLFEKVPVSKIVGRVQELMTTYWIAGGLVDRHPESETANNIRLASQNIILPCEYRGTKELHPIKDPLETVIYLQADRTMLLDEVAACVRRKSFKFSGYGLLEDEVTNHLRNMVREETPEKPANWKKLSADDHTFHALGFLISAAKYRNLQNRIGASAQTEVQIVGADLKGYTGDILGMKSAHKADWQRPLLR